MNKNKAFFWLIPILIILLIDLIILGYVFKMEFNSIQPGEPGHPTGLMTAFVAVVLLIPTVIISAIFVFITKVRYDKLSTHYPKNDGLVGDKHSETNQVTVGDFSYYEKKQQIDK